MAEYVVPLGMIAIGGLIVARYNCECAKRPDIEPYTGNPTHWRNRVGKRCPEPFDHNQDAGIWRPTSGHLIITMDGVRIPADMNRQPTLNPGMLTPDGRKYVLQEVHSLLKAINQHPAHHRPAQRRGHKKRDIKPMPM